MPEPQARVGSGYGLPFEEDLRLRPWRYDLFMLLRWLDARNPHLPRLGSASRPAEEVVRIGQRPSLRFAPANLDSVVDDAAGRLRIGQAGFGLFGPNGPLPLHVTEYVRERSENARDGAMEAFADLFHHRFALLFYRAWSHVQASAAMDRPGCDRHTDYVACLTGYGDGALRGRDAVADAAKFHFAGHLVRQTRNPEGLVSSLAGYFGCRVAMEERRFQWLALDPPDRTQLGAQGEAARLGGGALCGVSVPDRQYRFRLRFGPLDLRAYEAFLPAGHRCVQVRDWVRNHTGHEYRWDACLVLKRADVPVLALGCAGRLGWTTWLGMRATERDADDLVLDIEADARVGRERHTFS